MGEEEEEESGDDEDGGCCDLKRPPIPLEAHRFCAFYSDFDEYHLFIIFEMVDIFVENCYTAGINKLIRHQFFHVF